MKETGIIMSGNHPKLILDGIKTMTRRTRGLDKINKDPDNWKSCRPYADNLWGFVDYDGYEFWIKCPYGQVGDRLWVREKFALSRNIMVGSGYDIHYWTSANDFVKQHYHNDWQPSIHMSRKDSRITLEITELRAERLQEITEEDALAEGAPGIATHKPYEWASNPWVWVISFKVIE